MVFSGAGVRVTLFSSPPRTLPLEGLMLRISCRELDGQLSSLVQLCSSSFPLIPSLDRLDISKRKHSQLHWRNDIENVQWLDILRPLTAVKDLYLSKDFAPGSTGARRVKSDGSVIHTAKRFLGRAVPIETSPRSHGEIRCRATAFQPPYNSFSLGQKGGRVVGI